jgi:hypothetical protein
MFSSLSNWFGQFFSMEHEPYKIQHDYHQRAAEYLRQALERDEQSSILFKKIVFLFIFYKLSNR